MTFAPNMHNTTYFKTPSSDFLVCEIFCPTDWQGVRLKGKRPNIENALRAMARNPPKGYST